MLAHKSDFDGGESVGDKIWTWGEDLGEFFT